MIQILGRGGWHDIILTIMSHCDQQIAFCNHFFAPKLCFFNLFDILGWYVFEKKIPFTWKFNLFEPHHGIGAYGSHICQTLSIHWSNGSIFTKKNLFFSNLIVVSNNFGLIYWKIYKLGAILIMVCSFRMFKYSFRWFKTGEQVIFQP